MAVFSALTIVSGILHAKPACEGIKNVRALIKVSRKFEKNTDTKNLLKEVKEAVKLACDGKFREGSLVTYKNGKAATYSFGREGAAWYYPNGKVISYNVGREGAAWYYPNGKVISYSAGREGAAWYYPNGKVVSYSVGREGAAWYYPNGKVISYSVGREGASWYRMDGSLLTTGGPAIAGKDLLKASKVLKLLL